HRTRPELAAEASGEKAVGQPADRREGVLRWMQAAAATGREGDYRAAGGVGAQGALLGLVPAALCYAPFWVGLETFTGLAQQLRPLYYNGSVVGFFAAPLALLVAPAQQPALDKTIRLIFYALFFIYAYFQTQRLWFLGPRADLRHVITAAAKLVFAALLLITFWFQPWYVIWLLPLAALAEEAFVRRQALLLAAGALLTYAVSNFLFVEESDFAKGLFVQFFEILVAFGLLLLLRAAPYEQGWRAIIRRYAGLLSEGLAQRPVFRHPVMLVVVVVVAALLRLVRLGNNLFTTLPRGGSASNILKQISSDLKLLLVDPQGLHGPFGALQGLLVSIFGNTPFAALLPSAVIGSLTVLAIYLLTLEILRHGLLQGRQGIALLAAVLVATSRWHVSLSRSGMQIVLLPLLMCVALYWLLLGLRDPAGDAEAVAPAPTTKPQRRGAGGRARQMKAKRVERHVPLWGLGHRRVLYLIGAGL